MEQNTLNLLKTWYHDKPESLITRDSPLLKKLKTVRVEGKQQGLATLVGASSASGSFTASVSQAATGAQTEEFLITPGKLFSSWAITPEEELASKTDKGAYMPVAAWKAFASTAGFRKILASAAYHEGYGELCLLPAGISLSTTEVAITLPRSVLFSIDVGFQLEVAATKATVSPTCILTVKKIDMANKQAYVTSSASHTTLATDVLRYTGCVDANGKPRLPRGLDAWMPVYDDRVYTAGNDWANAIDNPFFGVVRNIAPDRLAGGFYKAGATETKHSAIENAILIARAAGSKADLIVMNDVDYLGLVQEVQQTNFVVTDKKSKKTENIGYSDFSAALASNYIENIVDDPFCPEGRFYVLDSEEFEIWAYTNTDKKDGKIVSGEPGREEPLDSEGSESRGPYQLLIDDCLTVQPGTGTDDGPTSIITLQLYGSFVLKNQADAVVGLF